MIRILLMSAGLLLGCAPSVPDASMADVMVNRNFPPFVLYRQGGQVLAVYQGKQEPPPETVLEPAAIRVIQDAAGCPVTGDQVETTGKWVAVTLDCAGSNSVFLRARPSARGRSGRARPYLPRAITAPDGVEAVVPE